MNQELDSTPDLKDQYYNMKQVIEKDRHQSLSLRQLWKVLTSGHRAWSVRERLKFLAGIPDTNLFAGGEK